jgi:hypothetical protein
MWRQVKVQCGNTVTTCWVEDKPELREGKVIDFRDMPGMWKVLWMSETALASPPRKGWHVGGL